MSRERRYARDVDEKWRQIRIGGNQMADLSEQMGGPIPHPLQSFVMPLVVTEEENGEITAMQVLGSAFCIGGIMMTAKHVLEPFYTPEHGLVDARQRLHAVFQTHDPPEGKSKSWGCGLPIIQAGVSPAHDVALLNFVRPVIGDWSPKGISLPLTFDLPPSGTDVLALGYPDSRVTATAPEEFVVDRQLVASQGTIKELHLPYRDSANVYFPALHADFPAPHGLSGGPVITEGGKVCGVVATGMETIDGNGWISTACLLRVATTLSIAMPIEGGLRRRTLRDLADEGVVASDGSHRHVSVEVLRDGSQRISL
jgi:hypothetical protein